MRRWFSKFRKQESQESHVAYVKKLEKKLEPELADLIDKVKVDVKPMEHKEFLNSIHNIVKEPALQEVLNYLVDRQIAHSIKLANTWERVLFDRATINGFELIKEELELLEGEFQDSIQLAEKYNKHDIL